MVSELLGSWGDNELSPECLDGAQRFLKEGGVSIPQEYTSFVAPMSSHKVTATAVLHRSADRSRSIYLRSFYLSTVDNLDPI